MRQRDVGVLIGRRQRHKLAADLVHALGGAPREGVPVTVYRYSDAVLLCYAVLCEPREGVTVYRYSDAVLLYYAVLCAPREGLPVCRGDALLSQS